MTLNQPPAPACVRLPAKTSLLNRNPARTSVSQQPTVDNAVLASTQRQQAAGPEGGSARRSSLPARSATAGRSVDFKAVNQAALKKLPAILERLAPGGEYRGSEYVMRNPHREDRHLGSFSVNTRTGRWADFATGDRGGDVISLVAFLEKLRPITAARNLARMLELAGEEGDNA